MAEKRGGPSESAWSRRVTRALEAAGEVVREPRIDGVVPDFLLRTRDGQTVVVETKHWREPPSAAALKLAQLQTLSLQEATGADRALLVVPSKALPRVAASGSVALASEATLRDHLEGMRRPAAAPRPGQEDPVARAQRSTTDVPTVFVAMPFAGEFEDVFTVAMAPAAKAVGAACVRVDEAGRPGDAVQQVKDGLRACRAVIADVSGARGPRANVLYELGFAHGLGKPAILVCCTALDALPFDIRNEQVVTYRAGQTTRLEPVLRARLQAVLGG